MPTCDTYESRRCASPPFRPRAFSSCTIACTRERCPSNWSLSSSATALRSSRLRSAPKRPSAWRALV
eukprot:scaffold126205_cov36-Tisochrysis_lutea.AAC.3